MSNKTKRCITISVEYDISDFEENELTPVDKVREITEDDMNTYFSQAERFNGLHVVVEDK